MRLILYFGLAAAGVAFVLAWRNSATTLGGWQRASWGECAIGFVTNFFDTLGIGSFAPTTALLRWSGYAADGAIPGTLLVGHTWPTLAQAWIYITIIDVDLSTLVVLVGSAAAGSWLGAGRVARWPESTVRAGVGAAMLVAAAIFLAAALGLFPQGGELRALHGLPLAIGVVGNFCFGALMTIGIGAYAPSLILFGLLGMDLKAVFPVMMGSCAFLMPAGGLRFLKTGSYAPRAALGLTIGGIPGVLLAAFLVREMSIEAIRWLVIVVVSYTAVQLLRSAGRAGHS